MQATWLSLIPPITVILAACLTRRISLSLFLGIISACLVATDFAVVPALQMLGTYGYKLVSSMDRVALAGFLLGVGMLIEILNHTGAALALAQTAHRYIKTKRGAQFCSMTTSCLLSLDDYLSILTTGYTMRPITDNLGVHPLKLAFLVHTFAGPLVVLTPFSSWMGVISENLRSSQLVSDPFFTYLMAIPFLFYPLLSMGSAWFIVHRNISFGPMLDHEKIPLKESEKVPLTKTTNQSIADFWIPMVLLIGSILLGMLYTGGYHLLGGSYGIIDACLHSTHTFLIMFLAVSASILVATIRALHKKQISAGKLATVLYEGILLMLPAMIMVLLALTLSDLLTKHIGTGNYLASLMLERVAPALLPALCFAISVLITMATGSSWGTFVVMLPTTISMTLNLLQIPLPTTPQEAPLVLIVIGAVLSGAVCGDHLSPFSETTTMTATSTQVNQFEHAYTQFIYMIPAVICTLFIFGIAGMLASQGIVTSAMLPALAGVGLCGLILMLADRRKLKA